ncbi:MAG: DUF3592 domain-containing protein [Ruminococcus sp.]|nr:DUF3592 domain-containing protein [Ruminococcus sp.]
MNIAAMILLPIGAVFILVAALIFNSRKKKQMRCTYKTTAIINDIDRFGRSYNNRRRNYGVYEYEYNGTVYRKRSYVGTSLSPEIGRMRDAYVNPEKPEECIIEGWVSALAGGLFLGFGILFIALAVLFLVIHYTIL